MCCEYCFWFGLFSYGHRSSFHASPYAIQGIYENNVLILFRFSLYRAFSKPLWAGNTVFALVCSLRGTGCLSMLLCRLYKPYSESSLNGSDAYLAWVCTKHSVNLHDELRILFLALVCSFMGTGCLSMLLYTLCKGVLYTLPLLSISLCLLRLLSAKALSTHQPNHMGIFPKHFFYPCLMGLLYMFRGLSWAFAQLQTGVGQVSRKTATWFWLERRRRFSW